MVYTSATAYFLSQLDHVVDVPVDQYALPPVDDDSRRTSAHPPPPLSVGVAKNSWPIQHAYEHWLEIGPTQPSFNWPSIVAFRRDDPIILLYLGIEVQALLQLKQQCVVPCPLGERSPLTYVSFLEVAPWNRGGAPLRKFRGLGQLMLRFACQRSRQMGWSGRLGLHALPGAELFYSRLGFSMPLCPNEYHETYFELFPEAAASLLAEE